jgi:DNA-binding transcriptional ArsR family regulator
VTKGAKELADIGEVFAALAHASRREILLVLRFRDGAMTAGEIAERFSCKWPTTTRHLNTLLAADLIRVRKEGRERLYELNERRLRDVAGKWLAWFAADDASMRS